MYISFTGHRDKIANEADLDALEKEFPGAVWVHGGAIGFDTQVEYSARKHKITTWVIRPNYELYGRRAPLVRNETILNASNLLIALYDGRKYGGTYFTLKKARELGKEVRIWEPA